MRVCIIGAGSPFGTNTAGYLLERGYRVMGIGRSPKKPDCFSLGIDYPYFAYHLTYELEYILEKIERFEPDYIVNYAAQGEGAASWGADNWRFYETNSLGLARLVGELNKRRNFERFIQIGTSELYGSRQTPADENAPVSPTSPYGVSKVAFDLHLKVMWERLKFPMNIIRPSNCIVEGQQLHRVVPRALIAAKTGRRMKLDGGGVARKSYLHGDDLSQAIELTFKAPLGEVYNAAPPEPTAIRDLVKLCADVAGVSFENLAEVGPERLGQDDCYYMSAEKLKAAGWSMRVSLPQAVERMWGWVNKYPELLRMDNQFQMRA